MKYVDSPSTKGGPHARDWSPLPGRSILITSAPRSDSIIVQYGPASTLDRSRTRRPASGPPSSLCERLADDVAGARPGRPGSTPSRRCRRRRSGPWSARRPSCRSGARPRSRRPRATAWSVSASSGKGRRNFSLKRTWLATSSGETPNSRAPVASHVRPSRRAARTPGACSRACRPWDRSRGRPGCPRRSARRTVAPSSASAKSGAWVPVSITGASSAPPGNRCASRPGGRSGG